MIWSFCFSPDGKKLASGFADGVVKVWDSQRGQELFTFRDHTSPVRDLAFSPDGRRLASTSVDSDGNTVIVWSLAPISIPRLLKGSGTPVVGIGYSPDGRRFTACTENQTVQVLDSKTWRTINTWHDPDPVEVRIAAFSPNGKILAGGCGIGDLRCWETETGKQIPVPNEIVQGTITSLAFSPDSGTLAVGSGSGGLVVFDLASGQQKKLNLGPGEINSPVYGLAFSPDVVALAGGYDAILKLWDVRTGKEIRTLKRPALTLGCTAFSANGRYLASGYADGTIAVWEVASGRNFYTRKGHLKPIRCLAFSPDGTRLASASDERTVKIWVVFNGQEALTLKGHRNSITSLAFSPDSRSLATASLAGTVRIWDAAP